MVAVKRDGKKLLAVIKNTIVIKHVQKPERARQRCSILSARTESVLTIFEAMACASFNI